MQVRLSTATLKATTIPTDKPLAGFAAGYAKAGDQLPVEVAGIHTFDEGLGFYKRLECFDRYLSAIGRGPGGAYRMLVVIGEKNTQIYVDEDLPIHSEVRPRRLIKAGEAVFRDDIACVDRIEIRGLELKEPAGLLLLDSVGWRRGMCFDLRAIAPKSPVTIHEAYETLQVFGGMLLSHLMFTELFLLEDADWRKLIGLGWFPFLFLPASLWEKLIQAVQCNGDLDAVEEQIHSKLVEGLPARLEVWRASEPMKPHMDFLDRAASAYLGGDWVSCVSLAVPRIEGLMRKAFSLWGKQWELIEGFTSAVKNQEHSRSLLFPDRLRAYFKFVLFPFIDFQSADLPATRHTLSHGLVDAERITRKQAMTTLMLIDHLVYCLPKGREVALA